MGRVVRPFRSERTQVPTQPVRHAVVGQQGRDQRQIENVLQVGEDRVLASPVLNSDR